MRFDNVLAHGLKFLFLAHSIFAWMFLRYSPGLVFYIDGESIGYVKDLMSSGSDDDVAIWLILFFDLFAFLILLWVKNFQWTLLITLIVFLFQFGSMLLMQVGSFTLTLLSGNIFAIGMVVIKILIIGLLLKASIFWLSRKDS